MVNNNQRKNTDFARKLASLLVLVGLVGFGGLVVAAIIFIKGYISPPYPQSIIRLSWGEEILIPGKNDDEKNKGADAFKNKDYKQAIQHFQQARKSNILDPEALIYLNNAKAALTDNPVSIAVTVPISNGKGNNPLQGPAEEILRGVALFQNYINDDKNPSSKINGRLLQVEIADDFDDKDRAKDVAETLVKQENILGVIGHYSSKITSPIGDIYGDPKLNDNRLVIISPTSTVLRKSGPDSPDYALPFNNYVFRIASTDSTAASDLVYYIFSQGQNTAAIIKKTENPFSNSLTGEFKRVFEQQQGQVVDECDLDDQNRLITTCINKVKNKVNFIVLALPRYYLEEHAKEAFIDNQMVKLGGDTLYGPNLLAVGTNAIKKLVIAVPWHRNNTNEPPSPFEQNSQDIWQGQVNWRTATAYDATKILIEGLKNTPSRIGLYKELKSDLSVEGATGKVEFDQLGDRKIMTGIGVIVGVQLSSSDPNQIEFFLLEKPHRNPA
jgi:branched-chain amino acid transport system substrate-binding protein